LDQPAASDRLFALLQETLATQRLFIEKQTALQQALDGAAPRGEIDALVSESQALLQTAIVQLKLYSAHLALL
jgi:hypothetical protein